jgi:glycosyltransferase involved in cell wall biosynthesis
MNTPIVSIGLPVYNAGGSVAQTLESILSQEFRDLELVIADNNSSDDTESICKSYASRDARVKYHRNKTNIGVNPNHDRVFEMSQGRYFMWAAHDLEWLPGMLKRCVEVMSSAPPSVVLVFPRCEMVQDGKIIPCSERDSIECPDPRPYRRFEAVVRHITMVNQLFGLMRRDALGQTQLNGAYASSDHVLLAELAMLGQLREIPEVLIRRRIDSHRGTASVCNNSNAWLKWLDPNHTPSLKDRLPHRERLALEYWLAAWRLPMKLVDKVPCLLLAPWFPYWRVLLRVTGPWRQGVRRLIRGPICSETKFGNR